MALRDHLEPEERIQARCDPFYATSLRLVRYQLTKEGELVSYSAYRRIQSVELVRKPQHKLMVMGTILGVCGFILYFYWGLITAIPTFFFGVGIIIYGGQGKAVYYQLHLSDMTSQEKEIWRIQIRGSKDFIAAIGDITGKRLVES